MIARAPIARRRSPETRLPSVIEPSLPASRPLPAALPDRARPYPDALFAWAIAEPDGPGLAVVTGDGARIERLSRRRALQHGAGAARALAAAGVRAGDRVLLATEHPWRFHAYLLGCMALRAIAVPAPGPGGSRDRRHAMIDDARPRLAVVDDAASGRDLGCDAIPAVLDDRPEPLRATLAMDGAALWLYTAGRGDRPRRIEVSHAQLVESLRATALAARMSRIDRVLTWLPLDQAMGVVGGLLFGAWLGLDTAVLPASAYTNDPEVWLRAVHALRPTVTIAPPSAWDRARRRTPDALLARLDLSCVRMAVIGGEPIDRDMIDGALRRFEPRGLSRDAIVPVYGLTEATAAAAMGVPGQGPVTDVVDGDLLLDEGVARPVPPDYPRARTVVAMGSALPDHRVVIVGVTGDTWLGDRRVGEIVVEGPAVRGGRVRTGDLGYLAGGRLYVVGRVDERIRVGPRRVFARMIERWAASADGVRRGRVIAADGEDGVHLVAEISARTWRTQPRIRAEIERLVTDGAGVPVASVTFVPPGALPRNGCGGLRRRACRDRLFAGVWSGGVAVTDRAAAWWRRVTGHGD